MSPANSTLDKFASNKPGDKRQATWLEVFFDLVFAVAVTQLGHYLHHHWDLTGLTIVHSGKASCLPLLDILLRMLVAGIAIAVATYNLLTLEIAIPTLVLSLMATVVIEERFFDNEQKESF